jgi:hypothetical protein
VVTHLRYSIQLTLLSKCSIPSVNASKIVSPESNYRHFDNGTSRASGIGKSYILGMI